jgi:hypothetical protein
MLRLVELAPLWVLANLRIIGIVVGIAALVTAAYYYGRHVQHGADRAAMADSYGNGYDAGLKTPRPTNRIRLDGAQVRGTVRGVEVRGAVPYGLVDTRDGAYSFAPGAFAAALDQPDENGVTPWRDLPTTPVERKG